MRQAELAGMDGLKEAGMQETGWAWMSYNIPSNSPSTPSASCLHPRQQNKIFYQIQTLAAPLTFHNLSSLVFKIEPSPPDLQSFPDFEESTSYKHLDTVS